MSALIRFGREHVQDKVMIVPDQHLPQNEEGNLQLLTEVTEIIQNDNQGEGFPHYTPDVDGNLIKSPEGIPMRPVTEADTAIIDGVVGNYVYENGSWQKK